jgi:hypothetical protein
MAPNVFPCFTNATPHFRCSEEILMRASNTLFSALHSFYTQENKQKAIAAYRHEAHILLEVAVYYFGL